MKLFLVSLETIRNRVKDSRWPDSAYEVVIQKGWSRKYNKWVWQFEVNQHDREANWKSFKRRNKVDAGDWQRASKAWETSATTNTVDGAHLFHADYMIPDWDWSKCRLTAHIGGLSFMRN